MTSATTDTAYQAFLARKLTIDAPSGFDPAVETPEAWALVCAFLALFQRDLVRWSCRRGRSAIFADTGLGKTRMQLALAYLVHCYTGRDVLILAPLAVAKQTAREGAKVGIEVTYARTLADAPPGIVVTNYDRLESHFADAVPYIGAVILDESSILKSFDGKTKALLIELFRETPFRLACTATPSPNDFTELGNHAEFLGIMTRAEMLATFFVHDGGSTQDWRLKGHAEEEFWKWVCSWGALVKKPSVLGYSDEGYDLPPLHVHEVVIAQTEEQARAAFVEAPTGTQGSLFAAQARGLGERRKARRVSIGDRVARCAEIVASLPADEPVMLWGDLNDETDALADTIPGAVQIKGTDTPERKEERLIAFLEGRSPRIVTKVKIAGFGINAQNACYMVFCGIPKDGSFEEWYQAVRREYRFGQRREVHVWIVVHETQRGVVEDLRRKEADAARMAEEMGRHTARYVREAVGGAERESDEYRPGVRMTLPAWLKSEAA